MELSDEVNGVARTTYKLWKNGTYNKLNGS